MGTRRKSTSHVIEYDISTGEPLRALKPEAREEFDRALGMKSAESADGPDAYIEETYGRQARAMDVQHLLAALLREVVMLRRNDA